MPNLNEKHRPHTLDDVVGQEKIAGPSGMARRMLDRKDIRSCIFYGPPGCGKTTVARIIAEQSGMQFVSLNATNAKLDDVRKAMADKDGPILLYLDEIQYFNRKQQQSLLPYVESGEMILIASTTDNPYYCCYDALLSRCYVMEFHPVAKSVVKDKLISIAAAEGRTIDDDAADAIAGNAAGDVRRAVNTMDMLFLQCAGNITAEDVKEHAASANMSGFDLDGDDHYGLVSGLQKSIRGSDPNAAIFYLARLLEGGDILSPCRRLLVIANEDIGMGNPMAVPFVYACVESAKQLGLPEASIPLSNAVIYLAISKKCCTPNAAYGKAVEDIRAGKGGVIPKHLRHAHTKDYKWPHAYPDHWIRQQYLPDDLVGSVYYEPGDNDFEQSMARHWSQVMSRG